MANESSPLLRGSNGETESSNGSYHTHGDAGYSHSVSVNADGGANGDQLYMGVDKRSLLSTPSCGLSSVEASRRLKAFGANELQVNDLSLGRQALHHVCRPKAALLWVAVALEMAQGKVSNAAILLLFQVATSLVGWLQQTRTSNALSALRAAIKPEAVVIRDGVHQTINASLLVPGDRLALTVGAVVPADCEVCQGSALLIDQSLLTGESFPVSLAAADSAKMGATVVSGEGDVIVAATGHQTFLATSALASTGGSDAPHFERVTVRTTAALLMIVVACAAVCATVQLVHRSHVLSLVSSLLVFIIVAVPLSLPAVSKLIVALGSRKLLDEKIILTRLESLEKLASMDVLCCDKTGTLTRNKLELQDDLPIFDPRGTREDVLVSAALAAKWKEPPRDAVDTLVLNAIDLRPLDQYTLVHHSPFDPSSKRTESVIRGPTGRIFKVTKGAPESLLALAHNVDDVRDAVEAKVMDLARRGISSLAVARAEESTGDKWIFLGVITYLDPPRHDSKRMIEKAHACGLSVKLTTGDQATIAVEACRQLGMGMTVLDAGGLLQAHPVPALNEFGGDLEATNSSLQVEAADGYAHVLPHHKVWIVDTLQQRRWACGVTGADVSDAAAMKVANVGIAVDGACDAARSVADVVLAKPGLSVIIRSMLAARQVFQRMCNYSTYQVLTTIHLVLLVAASTLWFRPDGCDFPHFFPRQGSCGEEKGDMMAAVEFERVDAFLRLPIAGFAIVGFTQEITSVGLLHDKQAEATQPQRWNFPRIFGNAVSSGVISAASSLLMVFWSLDSWNPDGALSSYHVGSLTMAQVSTVVFLQVALSSIFSVLVTRTESHALSSLPAPALAGIVVVNAALVTIVAIFSPFDELQSVSAKQVLFVWVYCLLWLFAQDATRGVVAVVMDEMSRIGALEEGADAVRFARVEAQRQNRIRLGMPYWSDESTVRDSFVVGRAVRSSQPNAVSASLGETQRRLAHLEAKVNTLPAEAHSQ